MLKIANVLCALLLGSGIAAPTFAAEEHFTELSSAVDAGEYRKIEAIIVERGGKIVYENYFGKSDADSRIDARSAGKSITALAVGMAVDDGSIPDIYAPAFTAFAAEAPFRHDGPEKQAITIADLMNMSSALECDDWDDASPGNEERMYRKRNWTRFALDIPIDPDYVRSDKGVGRFSYCTAGAFLLGRIVERATGMPFDDYVQQRLFTPLGISNPEWTRSPSGEVQSGGQLSLTARDFAAIGRLVLSGGQHEGRQLISKDMLGLIGTQQLNATPTDGYGWFWWRRLFQAEGLPPQPAAYMSGNGGNKVAIFPQLDTVIVILSTNYNRKDMHSQTNDIIERHILPGLVEAGDE
ncbi:serine hydrolase [Pacificimonas sp. WHA3]|uniref:Serine hydrolase n=1 Tax=Pacificimonas pallii TaxID=2827236 RepID=A0ABS6SGU6_9SPHN|nr:serine hydrolase domain-containing protein [Pacificimonas pallii]MBV7257638.1 serine hydrolase [Pacificimonas pallii]